MAQSVDFSTLGAMDEIDSGAFGTVYRLASYALPGFPAIAFKKFENTPESAEVANLTELIDFRTHLTPAGRAILDDAAAWPLCLVTDRGVVCGFLMQLIPTEFFGQQRLPSGRTKNLPIKAQWLVVDPAKADAAGLDCPRAEDIPARVVFAAKIAHVFGVMHKAGFVYGDLSLNNVMYSAAPIPRVMLVDCDAVQGPRSPKIGQAHTDDWRPPECLAGQQDQSIETDRYKLALFILRVLTPGPHASQSIDPGRVMSILDLDGNTAMRDALSTNAWRRPSAKDWFEYLTRYLADITSPPRITSVTLD